MPTENIHLRCEEAQLAPSREKVVLYLRQYPDWNVRSVKIEVTDIETETIYETSYPCDGSIPETLSWDGENNRDEGEPFATPLRSPYEIWAEATYELKEKPLVSSSKDVARSTESCESSSRKDKVTESSKESPWGYSAVVKVLYHSIEIVRGPWVANAVEKLPAMSEIALHFNRLGYHAGPVVDLDQTYVDRAYDLYCKNHPTLYLEQPSYPEAKTASPHFKKVLEALTKDQRTRPCFGFLQKSGSVLSDAWSEATEKQKLQGGPGLLLCLEAIGSTVDFQQGQDEFLAQYSKLGKARTEARTKCAMEGDRLNRPVIPVEAHVFLQNSKKQRVWAPRAVGAVRVDWSVSEPKEDLSHLFDDDGKIGSFSKRYVTKVKRQFGGDDENEEDNNCHADYGGIRTDDDNWWTPFWVDGGAPKKKGAYPPYELEVDDDEEVVFSRACVDAKEKRCLGKAGVLFHPSRIAGDRYRLQAALHLEGTGNESLASAHGPIECKTDPITVWRYAKVGAVIEWPTRFGSSDWQTIWSYVRAEYARAYLDLDVSNVQRLSPTKCLSNDDYATWVSATLELCGGSRKTIETFVERTLDSNGLISFKMTGGFFSKPVVLLDEDTLARASIFGQQMLAGEDTALQKKVGPVLRLNSLIQRNLRRNGLEGFFVLDYAMYKNLPLKKKVKLDPVAFGDKSVGFYDRFAVVNHLAPGYPPYIYAHEMAHCLWLRHHEGVREPEESKVDHDQADHNCMMSYTSPKPKDHPHQTPKDYRPHFCGKCNLKLRGWDVARLPGSSEG